MKKLVFLTMMFGLMMVFSGSFSAQAISSAGRLPPRFLSGTVDGCKGIRPKVGDALYFKIMSKKSTGASVELIRGNGELFSERVICRFAVDVEPTFSQRWFAKVKGNEFDGVGYTARVTEVFDFLKTLEKGVSVSLRRVRDGDKSYDEYSFSGVGGLTATLDDPKSSWDSIY